MKHQALAIYVLGLAAALTSCSSSSGEHPGSGGTLATGGAAGTGVGGAPGSQGGSLAATSGGPGTSGGTVVGSGGSGGAPNSAAGGRSSSAGGTIGASGGSPGNGGTVALGTGGAPGRGGVAGGSADAGLGGATTMQVGGASGAGGAGIGGATAGPCSNQAAPSGADTVVDTCTRYQSIRGFGASSAWNTLTASDHTYLWDTTSGAGLSMLRLRIDETASTTSSSNAAQLSYAKIAAAKGVLIWAAPWSPQTAWQTKNGSQLLMNFTYAQQWASALAQFAKDAVAMGVPLFAISSQNEPDGTNFNHFTAPQIVDWIKTYLGPAMQGTGVKIIAPETVNWCGFSSYEPAIMADATASSFVPILATHEYGCTPKAYPDIAKAGKEFWETEIYESETTTDEGINAGLNTAKLMHDALTISNVNAWHYWWIHGDADTGLFTNTSSTPSKRLWVMGNFSRFVRPGFVRVAAPAAPTAGVTMTAYYGNNRVVVVAINTSASSVSRSFGIAGMSVGKVTPWVTDSANNLQAQAAVTPSGNAFTYALPATSVTSLVVDAQ